MPQFLTKNRSRNFTEVTGQIDMCCLFGIREKADEKLLKSDLTQIDLT